MMGFIKITLFLLAFPIVGSTQTTQCDSSMVLLTRSSDLSLKVYSQSSKIDGSNTRSFETVEGLLSSLISAQNLNEHNEVFETPLANSKKDFDYYKNLSPLEFFILPQLSFYFEFNDVEYAYVKFYLNEKEKSLQRLIVLCFKEDGRWKIKSEIPFFISSFFKVIKTKYLIKILRGEKTDNEALNTIISENIIDGKVNIRKIAWIINEKMSKDNKLKEILEPK